RTTRPSLLSLHDALPILAKQADQLASATTEALAGLARGVAIVDPDRNLVTAAVTAVSEEFDPEFGGFGSPARKFRGTKFPTPPLDRKSTRLNSSHLVISY